MGIRYFDLRVCRTIDKHSDSKSPFTFTHGLLGDLVRVGLEEINEFLNKHSKEIILLDFNHFYDFNDQCGHDQLIHLIHEIFGKKLCTTARTISQCTLNYLWNNKQQVILLYEQNADQCTAYMDRIGHFFKVNIKSSKHEFLIILNRFVNLHGRIHHELMIYFYFLMKKYQHLDLQLVLMLYKDK
jgi:GGDEF domain-containing protein